MNLDRRRFIQLGALGVVAALSDSGCAPASDKSLDHPALVAILGPQRVRQLGAHYRAATPGENDAGVLRAAISNAGRASWLQRIRQRSVDGQIRDDFAVGRTVVVDGWVLALTEARQCALYSLTPA